MHCPSLEPLPIGPPHGIDDNALATPMCNSLVHYRPSLSVGRIVEDLDFKPKVKRGMG